LAANLAAGELAINIVDGKLYYENNSGVVTLLASAAGASGDVVGPASATDNAVARFDGTTGKLIQNGVVIIGDTGAVTGVTDLTASGSVTLSGGTANGVTYLNGSKVLTSGSALTYNGSTFKVAGTDATLIAGFSGTTKGVRIETSATGTSISGVDSSLVTSFQPLDLNGSYVAFSTSQTERMRLSTLGLAIGTGGITAGYLLDVRGGATEVVGNFISTGTTAYTPTAYNGSKARIIISGGSATGSINGIQYTTSGANENFFGTVQESGGAGAFVWQGYNGLAYLEKMRISAIGNVGIQNNNPSRPLSVRAFGATGSAADFNGSDVLMDGAGQFDLIIGDGGVAYMSLTTTDNATALKVRNYTGNSDIAVFERATGNVGIGESNPLSRLHVSGGRSYLFSGDSYGLVLAQTTAQAAYLYIGSNPSGNLIISDTIGTERVTVTQAGNLGINTANTTSPVTPQTWLDVRGPNIAIGVTALETAQGQAFIGTSDEWGQNIGGTLALGGGQNSGTLTATYASISGRRESSLGYIYTGYMQFGVSDGTNVVERARIDSSGNLLVNTTTTGAFFDGKITSYSPNTYAPFCGKQGESAASCTVLWNAGTTGDNIFEYFVTEATPTVRGTITYNRAGGLVAYNTTSDYRAKDISGPVTGSGALIDSIPVYMGTMKGATQERPMFIAHETPSYAHTGEKDAVDENGNPKYQQMDASALIPVMWAELQSLRKRLADAGI
jgi:hypothetical protein